LVGGSLGATAPAAAAVDFSISLKCRLRLQRRLLDRDHHWHWWRNKREAEYFHAHFTDHYVDVRHDRGSQGSRQGLAIMSGGGKTTTGADCLARFASPEATLPGLFFCVQFGRDHFAAKSRLLNRITTAICSTHCRYP
jgi:hypothetical protein